MPAPLNPIFTIRTSDEVANGEPVEARQYHEIKRHHIEAASERLLNALHRAFDLRVDSRGCSHFYAQTYLMNGREP